MYFKLNLPGAHPSRGANVSQPFFEGGERRACLFILPLRAGFLLLPLLLLVPDSFGLVLFGGGSSRQFSKHTYTHLGVCIRESKREAIIWACELDGRTQI